MEIEDEESEEEWDEFSTEDNTQESTEEETEEDHPNLKKSSPSLPHSNRLTIPFSILIPLPLLKNLLGPKRNL